MDRINVLAESNSRQNLFTKELLAETNDAELQEIVKNASEELNSPIALVSLVLDQVQFFKAHIGLPPVLAEARGTHRDVSFCQFVVKDGEAFEVNDAANDPRIPQHVVKEYNIQSYLGVPIKLEEAVMGSLCVLDTKKRDFSKEEHASLKKLADLVNIRLKYLTKDRRQTRLDLTEATLIPAIKEMYNSLASIERFIQLGYSSGKSIKTYLNHSNHIFSDKLKFTDAIRLAHEAAATKHEESEDFLLEMEFSLKDSIDCLKALEALVTNAESTNISEIVTSAQDLSRHSTKLIGGFTLPDFKSDPVIYAKGNLALAIATNCLLTMSEKIGKRNSNKGIELKIDEKSTTVELIFTSVDIDEPNMLNVVNKLNNLISSEMPSLKLRSDGAKLILEFNIIVDKSKSLDR